MELAKDIDEFTVILIFDKTKGNVELTLIIVEFWSNLVELSVLFNYSFATVVNFSSD